MTHVEVRRFAACPFSAAVELAERAVDRLDDLYVSPFPPLGERVVFATTSAPDRSDDARKHDALLIAWHPQNRRMFPDFHGALTVRPKYNGVVLQLSGAYNPPYGLAGKAFDMIAGRSIAKSSLHHLLGDLAALIVAEYETEKRDHQTA